MFGRTLWKGPRICSPAYDLKLRLTKCVIIRRGAPGSLVIAGGGGGGMLPRISSKLRLSTASAASPWDGSVAQTKKPKKLFIPLCESFQVVVEGGDSGAWGKGSRGAKKTNKQKHKLQQQANNDSGEKLLFFFVLETQPQKRERHHGRLLNTLLYKRSVKRWYVRVDAPHSFRR